MAKVPTNTRSVRPKIQKEKSLFEKIKSPAEARVMYGQLPNEGREFYCKGEGPLFAFKPVSFEATQGLRGEVRLFDDGEKLLPENVVVNFSVGKDRYYTVSDFTPLPNGKGILQLNDLLYRLERREFYRVALPDKMNRDCNIIAYDGRSSFVAAVIMDLSVGGARLQVLKGKLKEANANSVINCVLHIKDKWTFELKATIRHVIEGQKTDVYGIQFMEVSDPVQRKLISLLMELQREVLRERAQV